MIVAAIKEKITEFKSALRKNNQPSPFWEMHLHFRENWNNRAENPVEMFDQSLQSQSTRTFWKRDRYRPKEMMLHFFDLEPDYSQNAFRELFDESIPLDQRLDRFIFYSDQLLSFYKKAKPRSIENHHYQDYPIISLYLAMRDPHHYSPYQFNWFQGLCRAVQAHPSPSHEDPVRYFKMCRIVKKFLEDDPELAEIYSLQLMGMSALQTPPMETLFPAADFSRFCAEGIEAK